MTVVDDSICRKVREIVARLYGELVCDSSVAWSTLVSCANRAQLELRDVNTEWARSILRARQLSRDPVKEDRERRIQNKADREQAAKRSAEIRAELQALTSQPTTNDGDIAKVFALRRELSQLEGKQ